MNPTREAAETMFVQGQLATVVKGKCLPCRVISAVIAVTAVVCRCACKLTSDLIALCTLKSLTVTDRHRPGMYRRRRRGEHVYAVRNRKTNFVLACPSGDRAERNSQPVTFLMVRQRVGSGAPRVLRAAFDK